MHPSPGAVLLQLEPLSGPVFGGTYVNFRPPNRLSYGSEYAFRFGFINTLANTSVVADVKASNSGNADVVGVLQSIAPPANGLTAGRVDVSLSMNGQQVHASIRHRNSAGWPFLTASPPLAPAVCHAVTFF